ncbi:cyclic AMP-dependent transcription factor ATF-7 [Trichonephila inaurata madagascariensis]|uniref:Cyclic AMP-dependent transcription factor ATF-7 n=1 Tax=Trichonephila inaurata madagascariensis TaxID=2747483 RepID=A0A8X7C5E9_9ARAC|nr:cyclic AMP-dependent transcription factor ATF-7 [Trichonephila inaurata madagascariensis]
MNMKEEEGVFQVKTKIFLAGIRFDLSIGFVADYRKNMSFEGKDNLDMTTKRQELSLSLTPSTPFKSMFIDETPTPTRFLNALESEMFQELAAENPFDATFRKANSGNGPHTFLIPESSSLIASLPDSEVLNTPSITLPSELETSTILRSFSMKKSDNEVSCQPANENTTDTLPFTPDEQSDLGEVPSETVMDGDLSVENTNFPTIDQSRTPVFVTEQSSVLKTSSTRTSVVQTPVITSIGSSTPGKSNASGVPTAVVVTRPTNIVRNLAPAQIPVIAEKTNQVKAPEQPQAIVQSVCVTPMVQFLLLANAVPANAVPVATAIPVNSSAPTQVPGVRTSVPGATSIITPATQLIQTVTSSDSQVPTTTSVTKMKLKEVITLNKNGRGRSSAGKIQILSKPTGEPLVHENLLAELGISPPSSPTEILKLSHQGRKRRDTSDDPDEKRKRSLERNRAAATRCREKRKQWITALERKADELANTNTHLQHEVSQLRNEVAHLKSLLLAHKDCPVTLQQKMTFESEREAYTTVHVINPSSDDLQRVPNSFSSFTFKHRIHGSGDQFCPEQ